MIEIYSNCQKKLRGDLPDAYTYDDLPRPLRVQIVHEKILIGFLMR